MRFRRFVSGALFVLGVYFFGMYLTAADGGPALTDHLLFVACGSNRNAGIDCEPAGQLQPIKIARSLTDPHLDSDRQT